uniref:Peptidyl carrier protein n=1 Tax=Streptomyces sp. MJ635-86F5 TaxID=1321967 RepID=X5IY87_9ACTN|nr:peptidyl carrier protein [Streptomyces sp. MJ635-86F5]
MWDERFEEILRRFVPFLTPDDMLEEDLALRDFGLDSMGTVGLLAELESAYGIKFRHDSLDMENFSTPRVLWTTVGGMR